MIDYPEGFAKPDFGSYTGVVDSGLIRTPSESPNPVQRVGFNAPRVTVSLTFHMSADDLLYWLQWVDDEAWKWFNMPLVSPYKPVKITSTHPVRFISTVQITKQGDDWYQTQVTAEIMQADSEDPDVPPVEAGDFNIAGTPLDPSDDNLITSGFPYAPSGPHRYVAELYRYY